MSHVSLTPAKYAQQMKTAAPVAIYTESVRFEDGSHFTLTVEDPNYVEVRGRHEGEDFDISLRADAAEDEADLLLDGNAPDAMWTLPPGRARRLGNALTGAAVAARHAIPEDVTHESSDRIALDGGHADVDVFSDRIEVTVRLDDRTVLGIALTHMEAAALGRAIASPHGATTGDLFHVADELGVDASSILRLRETAVSV